MKIMEEDLFNVLKKWRDEVALKLNLKPSYKVLNNKVLKEIALKKPNCEEDLFKIKGLGLKKIEKYGFYLLKIIQEFEKNKVNLFSLKDEKQEKIFTVSEYLDLINLNLKNFQFKVKGEISSIKDRGKLIYFNLKDKKDESILKCKIFKTDYLIYNSSFSFKEGLEVIVGGRPDIYKKSGDFNFLVYYISLIGQGDLKKAYEELKLKLKKEGLFDLDKKKKIKELPEKIGLITSEKGEAIHDFLNNLKKFGFKIYFYDSRVQGVEAVKDILNALNYFKDKDIDVLVIIRGGGQIEGFDVFNNEILIRSIFNFPKPVLMGIGHERDVPLATLVADKSVSTPTAVAYFLNDLWQKIIDELFVKKLLILRYFEEGLIQNNRKINSYIDFISERMSLFFNKFDKIKQKILNYFSFYYAQIDFLENSLFSLNKFFLDFFKRQLEQFRLKILNLEKLIFSFDPKKPLSLGYSLVKLEGKILKSVKLLKKGQKVEVELKDGNFISRIEEIKNYE